MNEQERIDALKVCKVTRALVQISSERIDALKVCKVTRALVRISSTLYPKAQLEVT